MKSPEGRNILINVKTLVLDFGQLQCLNSMPSGYKFRSPQIKWNKKAGREERRGWKKLKDWH